MKKIIIILFLSVIVIFGGLILSKWIANIVTNRFDASIDTDHFTICYNIPDEQIIPDIEKSLENNYQRITADLKAEPGRIRVKIYSDLNSLHRALKVSNGLFWWATPDLENWVVGNSSNGTICLVSPLDGSSGHTYDEILQVAVHEFTHAVSYTINSKPGDSKIRILSEGIAMYEAGQTLSTKWSNNKIVENLPNSIEELFSYNNTNDPEKMYGFGYLFVAYIVENYGYDKFIELYKQDYSNDVFDDDICYIYDNWICSVKNFN